MKVLYKESLVIFLLSLLLVISPVFANNQGFETIDCNTKTLKDSFSTSENVCIKETRVLPGGDCGDGGDTIQAYVLNYRTNYNTPDGSFFYTDGRSLSPYVKKSAITINADRTIFYNLGTFSSGSYDVAQGGNDYRGNDLYQGGCLDELGSPLVSAGFDVVAPQQEAGTQGAPCTADFSCNSGLYCDKSQPLPNGLGICRQKTTPTCTEDWNCGDWVCVNGKVSRGCTDLNGCGTANSKPETEYSGGGECIYEFAKSKDNPASLLKQAQDIMKPKTTFSTTTTTTTSGQQPDLQKYLRQNPLFAVLIVIFLLLIYLVIFKRKTKS